SGSWPSGQASLPPVPPSRSAAQLHGRRNCAPAGDAQQPCHHENRSFPWSCPSGGRRGLRYDYAAPASCCASSQSICSMAPIPPVRQKRSKELSTSCQAVSRLGTSASDEGVVIVVMALLSFADSTPRA